MNVLNLSHEFVSTFHSNVCEFIEPFTWICVHVINHPYKFVWIYWIIHTNPCPYTTIYMLLLNLLDVFNHSNKFLRMNTFTQIIVKDSLKSYTFTLIDMNSSGKLNTFTQINAIDSKHSQEWMNFEWSLWECYESFSNLCECFTWKYVNLLNLSYEFVSI